MNEADYEPPAEVLTMFDAWLLERPKHVAEVAKQFPPWNCYQLQTKTGKRGHYTIHSFDEKKDGTVTVTLTHGRDSFLPGVAVFGVSTSDLVPCGCGNWRGPTPEQISETRGRIESERARLLPDDAA